MGPFGWLFAVVLIDVAHVYATIYRVYANPRELRRRPALYTAVPILAYLVSVGLYLHDGLTFWRVLAYLAVWHFVRQQYGWIRLCGRKERAFTDFDRRLDAIAVYVGTIYPLIYWHAHLPRRFVWFIEGDFLLHAPNWLVGIGRIVWLSVMALWLGRQIMRVLATRSLNATRVAVMATTWLSWYLGIVHYDSDIAFTLMNVLPHGVPYFVLLYRYRQNEQADVRPPTQTIRPSPILAALLFYLPLALLAFAEEGLWDRLVWHEHEIFFPLGALFVSDLSLCFLVPLLALPQATHYLLDAWIWKVGPQNPDLRRHLGL